MTNKPKGRRPAHLEMMGGKSPRQRIWEKIREMRGFTLRSLVLELPGTIHPDTTRTYVKSLEKGGFLTVDSGVYTLARDNGVEAPRVRRDGSEVTMGRAQENIWQTLRRTPQPIAPRELAAMASTDAVPVSIVAVRDYLANLNHAGYLVHRDGAYRLKPDMNTGPRPPMVQRIRQVFDPNLGRVIWASKAPGGDDD